MNDLRAQVEAILFLASRPLSLKKLAELVEAEAAAVEQALGEIQIFFDREDSGLRLFSQGKEYQLVTAPAQSKLTARYLQEEVTGELSRPSLETLTIIAYRGPITKPELEQIRGVNCGLILRNLLIRGLIQEGFDTLTKMIKYTVTIDFLKFLGLPEVTKLPDYKRLHADEVLKQVVTQTHEKIF